MDPPSVAIYATRLDLDRDADDAVLDDGERAQLARFTAIAPRRRYAASHAFLRQVLGAVLGVDPAALRYDRTCEHCGHPDHGRPRLAEPPTAASFSLSHSDDVAVVAVGPGPVGVDVEALARRPVEPRVVRRTATPAEQALLPPPGAPGYHRATLALWTRKEAVAKALGLGITLPFRSFEATPGAPIEAGPPGSPVLEIHPIEVVAAVASVAVPVGTALAGEGRIMSGRWTQISQQLRLSQPQGPTTPSGASDPSAGSEPRR